MRPIRNKHWRCFMAFALAAFSFAALAGGIPGISPASAQEYAEPTPEEVLRTATDYLENLKSFSFKCEMAEDTPFEGGREVKSLHDMTYYVKRPDKLRFRTVGDLRNRQWFYDGKTLTAQDLSRNLYSQVVLSSTIDGILTRARDELNLRLAVTALGKTDLYEMLVENVKDSVIVGMSRVRGTPCYQLLLERDEVDLQLWIQAGKRPLLRKALIRYKNEEGKPEWGAVFTKWNTSARLADSFFEFRPPRGATRIEFLRQVLPKP